MSSVFNLQMPFDPRNIFPVSDGIARPEITTLSGGTVNFSKCSLDGVTIEDVAVPLSRIPRFNGQTRKHYSVAEHCLWVARYLARLARNQRVDPMVPFIEGLLHDAQEAFLCDLPSPLKHYLGDSEYAHLEHRLGFEVYRLTGWNVHYGSVPGSVLKGADLVAYAVENRDLRGGPDHSYLPHDRIIPVGDTDVVAREYINAVINPCGYMSEKGILE